MSHIILVGFAGVGKTTIGRQLALSMDRPFLDLDEFIEQEGGRAIRDIFENEGEAVFREIESGALRKALQMKPYMVIATGGGTPCFNNNMDAMKQLGKVIYLKAGARKIQENLKKSTKMGQVRPLFSGEIGDISLEKINFLLEQRIQYYEQSHAICGIERLQIPDLLTITADLLTKSVE